MEKKKEQAKVLSQEMLADGIYSLWIETEAARTARPGQFVSVYTADASKLLPRPISICEIDKEGKKLRLRLPGLFSFMIKLHRSLIFASFTAWVHAWTRESSRWR